jgi:hypothetical protein
MLRDITRDLYPFELIRFDWGGHCVHTDYEKLDRLVRRCITAPANTDAWLDQVGLADGLKIIDVVERFWLATKTGL